MMSFSEEDNHTRLRNFLDGDAFKMVKTLFLSTVLLNISKL